MALLVLLILFITRSRSVGVPEPVQSDAAAQIPLHVSGLSKTYKGGYQAVNDVSFDVPAGVVLGLLGPNGAGKTTTMRMIMGLISPTEGEIELFGEKVTFGAPALQQVGALIEGPGFLPHLTGRKNLELYWRSTGRPGDPFLEEVLEIADLGSALDRKVKAYSQGMRQRLGIAQAMLGKPNLLVLDEPTNGLDPPQIMEMRSVMKAYAATGRTVIVSSHMLSEVEQTCSHVVVMHRGHLIATGEVSELLRDRGDGSLEELFMEMIGTDLTVGK
jgi:ABC-2 type transport system ATP-binding protein